MPWVCNAAVRAASGSLEQISIDRLTGDGAPPGRNDHLAVRRCDTSRRIQPRQGGLHKLLDDDLSFLLQFRPRACRRLVMVHIASCRKGPIDIQEFAVLKRQGG